MIAVGKPLRKGATPLLVHEVEPSVRLSWKRVWTEPDDRDAGSCAAPAHTNTGRRLHINHVYERFPSSIRMLMVPLPTLSP
jgi:hypothetical protein